MTLARKHSKYNAPQLFVEMLLLQNKPRLFRYKKIRAMSFLPSVECGKFNSKQAFQRHKILACTKKSEICATSILKLIKNDAKMPGSVSLFHMHVLLESDYAIFTYILHFFALSRNPKSENMAQFSHPKYVPGCACFNGHSILVTA